MNVLAVNVGSSSLKLSLIGPDDQTLATHVVERWESGATDPIVGFLGGLRHQVDAVAHRVVHGGDRFQRATQIDDEVIDAISALGELAPLHQPRALSGIRATRSVLGPTIEVACFDTAFHADLPAAARTYALPAEWRDRWPVRRFGFHGLSHAYASRRASHLIGSSRANGRIVTCHLGSGASLCAIKDGYSVDTTMGFTPVEGLVMGTRSGSLDPGLILWLIETGRLSPAAVSDGIEHRGGLVGLSGVSGDMRDVLEGLHGGDPHCRLAFDVYIHRLSGYVGSMVVALGGLDLLVFTGGAGERSPEVRLAATTRLGHLGVYIDADANSSATGDADISASGSAVRTVVVAAREDLEMARQTRQLIGH